jgi:hypothetical protein
MTRILCQQTGHGASVKAAMIGNLMDGSRVRNSGKSDDGRPVGRDFSGVLAIVLASTSVLS